LITEGDFSGHIADLPYRLVSFLTGLEKRGVTLRQLPDDLLQVGCFNTACGGLRSNGSRTSLRNLVVMEGLEFTKFFLENANKGAIRLGMKADAPENPFLAELEWLSLVGNSAATLLEDRSRNLHLLDAVTTSFLKMLKSHQFYETEFLNSLPNVVANELRAFQTEKEPRLDQHYARVYAFVRTHPQFEIVGADVWNSRLDVCAQGLTTVAQTGVLSSTRSGLQ
jgi:hypothetical protein